MPQQPLLPVSEALIRVMDGAERLGEERVSLSVARGRTLAEPIVAPRTQPPFALSAMDGYAVRAADVEAGTRLRLVGESAAGHPFDGRLTAGDAVRIFTGGAVPAGADAVLIQEEAEAAGREIVAPNAVSPGQFIRPAGLDFRAGDVLLDTGCLLSPRSIGLAAASGRESVSVARSPRVALLATGDELVPPGTEPGPAQISVSNTIALAGLIEAAGATALDLGIAPDDPEAIRAAARRALEVDSDILVTTGGASVGDRDLVREALGSGGLKLDFWRIAMRPGRPMMFGRLAGMRMLGLPGNPVSAHVCAILFLVPLLRALQGRNAVLHRFESARLGEAIDANGAREDYLRGRLDFADGELPVALPFARQDSSMMKILSEAECLIVRPAGDPPRAAGEACRIIRLDANS